MRRLMRFGNCGWNATPSTTHTRRSAIDRMFEHYSRVNNSPNRSCAIFPDHPTGTYELLWKEKFLQRTEVNQFDPVRAVRAVSRDHCPRSSASILFSLLHAYTSTIAPVFRTSVYVSSRNRLSVSENPQNSKVRALPSEALVRGKSSA